jgi:hypothetical protein
MRMSGSVLIGIGLVLLGGLIGMMAKPKATHAAVGTFTTIVPIACYAETDGSGNFYCSAYTVPPERRLVIEQIAAVCLAPTGENMNNMQVNITEQGVPADVPLQFWWSET